MKRCILIFGILGATVGGSCGSTLPADLPGYDTRCARMNAAPIPPYDGDPHRGTKNVYACGVAIDRLRANVRPFPDGTVIVKDSTRDGDSFAWLIATARKQGGAWQWNEYTRNFADEEFRHVLATESVCTDCHAKARGLDWIFTSYSAN